MDLNITDQVFQNMWCNCESRRNNMRLESDLKSVHENVWVQGLLYVVCVICLYTMGVIAILLQSGVKFRSSSGSFCMNQIFECHDSIRRERRRRKSKLKKKSNDIELDSVVATKRNSKQQQDSMVTTKRNSKQPDIKVTNDPANLTLASTSEDKTFSDT